MTIGVTPQGLNLAADFIEAYDWQFEEDEETTASFLWNAIKWVLTPTKLG